MGKKETTEELAARKKAYQYLNNLNYGSYLKENRKRWEITTKKLSEGLCTKSLISSIETGKKSAGFVLRERLLRRSGVVSEDYESYLNYDDSMEWKLREEILDALEARDTKKMKKLLGKYADRYGLEKNVFWKNDTFQEKRKGAEEQKEVEDPKSAESQERVEKRKRAEKPKEIEKQKGAEKRIGAENQKETEKKEKTEDATKRLRRQFYLGMLGMCHRLAGAAAEELAGIFDTAVQQTVPRIHEGMLVEFVLCAEEINLVLEYARCLPGDDAIWQCRQLEQYLRNARMEDSVKALNYPKIIFILGQLLLDRKGIGKQEYREIIQLCDRGIELLQKTKRVYYLWELFGVKKAAVVRAGEQGLEKGIWVQYMLKEMEEWTVPFGHLYEKFSIKKEQGSDAYLYRGQDIYDVGDVIRIRRKMLGMTQEKFQEKLTCTLETLQNLEKKKHGTQPFYLQQMCIQLGLSPVCERTELVAASWEARTLEREIRYTANTWDFKKNLEQMKQLKKMIDMSHPINQQWVLRTEGMAKYREEQIKYEEYEEMIKQSFMYTLPLSVMEYPDEKECYLTNSEMEGIYHYALLVGDENPEEAYRRMKVVFRLEGEFEREGREVNHIRTYELYMRYKAKLLSLMGEYRAAQQYAERTIYMCLRMGRINLVDSILYTWIRNKEIQSKKAEPTSEKHDLKMELQCCLGLSQFCQNSKQENFFEEIINKMTKEI